MKKLIFAMISILGLSSALAQTEISGNVKDDLGSPIPGANVIIKGTTTGTTTDFDGNFTLLTDLEGDRVLQISYLGFTTHNEPIQLNGTSITLQIVLKEGGNQLDEVVLTASSTFRSQKQAPLSISSIKQAEITKLSANSQADILRSVPGITAEGGGGETATNVFVRGLPSGGQYVFNPLQYDGAPLISSFGLNSSAHDVYARPDIGFKGVEFVRGGAAVLYGAGSVAGIINYTSKTGDTDANTILNLEWADEGRFKTDFYNGGSLGGEDSNTYYAITGFLRYDEGPLRTGLPTRGGQFRANIRKKFDDNKGHFTIHGQYIDDKAQFYLPLPLQAGNRERIRGNDGEQVSQLLSGELDRTSFLTPGGVYESPVGDGVATKGGYLLADFLYNFDNDLTLKSKARYASYEHSFALYVGGNGAIGDPDDPNVGRGNPITLNDFVGFAAPGNLGFNATYQGTTQAINGNDLVVENLHVDRIRPLQDYSGEISLTKTVETLNGGSHNITFGAYLARSEAEDINFQYRVLSEFNNNPRLVNLSYTDAGGQNVIFSEGGLYNRIGQTSNRFLTQNRTALYLTDEIIANRWRFDVGFRWERTEGTFNDGNIVETTVYDNPELTPELANVRFADGSFTRASVDASAWAVSLAALYELDDDVNLYANFSKGFFFPQLRGFAPIATGITGTQYDAENIIQFEAGAKIGNEKLSGSLAAYYVGLSDRISLRQAIQGGGNLVDVQRNEQNTATFGVEATWDYRFAPNFSLRGTATYQDHEITKNIQEDLVNGGSTRTNEGNELSRQPNFLGTLGVYYDDRAFDAVASVNHTGNKFASDANNIELEAISIVRIGAGYTFGLGEANESLRLGFSVFNLLDDEGVTEGNPRDLNQTAGGDFFFGRPILPRRLFVTATFNF